MPMFLTGLYDTDNCDNDTDHGHNNTSNPDDCFQNQIMYLSLYFPFVPPPIILEVLKMYSFWRKGEPHIVLITLRDHYTV